MESQILPNILQKGLSERIRILGRSGTLPIIPPRESAHTAEHPLKKSGERLCSHFFAFFCFPKRVPNFTWKKHRKNCQNQWFWAPKTLPKSIQNRSKIEPRKNTRFFISFSSICLFFYLQFLWISDFPWGKPLFLRFSRKSCFCNLHAFCIQKSSQKPLQNEARRVNKSMPKTCCFSTSIFSRFGLHFGRIGAPKIRRAARSARRVKPHCILCLQ